MPAGAKGDTIPRLSKKDTWHLGGSGEARQSVSFKEYMDSVSRYYDLSLFSTQLVEYVACCCLIQGLTFDAQNK